MRSRAHFKAHPIHPALIPFPFAFLWGAAIFDLLYLVTSHRSFTETAAYLTLGGIGAGLLAAVPGVIDYLYAVPPESSGKRRATKHAFGNVTALVLFLVSWLLRQPDTSMSASTLVLELAGAAIMGYAGLLGGELVVRNMISVNHRYANTGKWNEATFDGKSGDSIVVAEQDELQEGHMKLLWVNGERIALARTPKGYCAFQDSCTHRGGSLAGGVLVGGTVHCLWHGSQFNVHSGDIECGPAKKTIKRFDTRTRDGKVTLVVP
jgi:uncharacterized membrane protein/nitrite reductase/ring-hydroxylating ferredoxin subunit